jgi:hypothetical protein
MLSKCIDVGRAQRAQPVGTPRPTKLLTASSFTPPASFHLHSAWQRAGVLCGVLYRTALFSATRDSSSEQERPREIASSYLEFERRAYSPTTVAPSPNAYGLERLSARTVFATSWLSPSDS